MTDPSAPGERAVAVVLAAGLGTRMRSRLPKLLHPILGRPMLGYVLDVAVASTGCRPVIVTSPATAATREVFADIADFALQEAPIGTGDAVRAGLTAVPADADVVLVLNGDVPRMHPELPGALLAERRAAGAAVAITSVETAEPGSLGRVVRDEDGEVSGIVEAKDATDEQLDIAEINAGIYAFDAAWLRQRIGDLRPSPASGELYLTDLVRFAHEDGAGVDSDRRGGRRPAARDQRPAPAGRGRGRPASRDQHAPPAGRGDDAGPVDRLHRAVRRAAPRT